jgi:TonB family protein
VLSNYEGACCAKYKKGGPVNTKPAVQIGEKPKSDVPEALDRTMIANGVGPVKARVMSCGDKSSAKGTVKVSVKVNPDGSIASVSVKSTPDPGLGSCVQGAMSKARFQKTQTGGTFGYPFIF